MPFTLGTESQCKIQDLREKGKFVCSCLRLVLNLAVPGRGWGRAAAWPLAGVRGLGGGGGHPLLGRLLLSLFGLQERIPEAFTVAGKLSRTDGHTQHQAPNLLVPALLSSQGHPGKDRAEVSFSGQFSGPTEPEPATCLCGGPAPTCRDLPGAPRVSLEAQGDALGVPVPSVILISGLDKQKDITVRDRRVQAFLWGNAEMSTRDFWGCWKKRTERSGSGW